MCETLTSPGIHRSACTEVNHLPCPSPLTGGPEVSVALGSRSWCCLTCSGFFCIFSLVHWQRPTVFIALCSYSSCAWVYVSVTVPKGYFLYPTYAAPCVSLLVNVHQLHHMTSAHILSTALCITGCLDVTNVDIPNLKMCAFHLHPHVSHIHKYVHSVPFRVNVWSSALRRDLWTKNEPNTWSLWDLRVSWGFLYDAWPAEDLTIVIWVWKDVWAWEIRIKSHPGPVSLAPLVLRCLLTSDNTNVRKEEEDGNDIESLRIKR